MSISDSRVVLRRVVVGLPLKSAFVRWRECKSIGRVIHSEDQWPFNFDSGNCFTSAEASASRFRDLWRRHIKVRRFK
jgi:hypothetical protein